MASDTEFFSIPFFVCLFVCLFVVGMDAEKNKLILMLRHRIECPLRFHWNSNFSSANRSTAFGRILVAKSHLQSVCWRTQFSLHYFISGRVPFNRSQNDGFQFCAIRQKSQDWINISKHWFETRVECQTVAKEISRIVGTKMCGCCECNAIYSATGIDATHEYDWITWYVLSIAIDFISILFIWVQFPFVFPRRLFIII